MSAAWLTDPVMLTGMRMFECGSRTVEQCDYLKQRWHFWYIADYVFALPTVAFFMSVIGIFIISRYASITLLRYTKPNKSTVISRLFAASRYLSYRGFHVSRLQWNSAPLGVLLLGAVGTIFFFCMDLAPKPYYWAERKFGSSPPLATRSGWLSLACMPFVFATASKSNWITLLTGVSHERLQVFHRWISYAFFILALLHTFPFMIYHIHWHDMEKHFAGNLLFYWTGVVAIIFQAWLTFMSASTIRTFGYEFFKITHFVAVIVFMLTFFWHCDYTLTSWHYFVATAAVYVPCFVYPWLRTIFEYKWTKQACVTVESNGFIRVSIPVDFHWTPGQHCFLRFLGFGILHSISSHPFTISSTSSRRKNGPSELVFFIRRQDGFTRQLYQHALENPNAPVRILIDGPYGGVNTTKLRAASHQLLIVGGSGAGWCLPFIDDFMQSAATVGDEEQAPTDLDQEGNIEAKPRSGGHRPSSLRIVFVTRDMNSQTWFEHAVHRILEQYTNTKLSSSVHLRIYLTGETESMKGSSKTTVESSSSPQSGSGDDEIGYVEKGPRTSQTNRAEGRPELPQIVKEEAALASDANGTLAVCICGPSTMQNDVRNAVASENLKILNGVSHGGVYLHSEHFSWA